MRFDVERIGALPKLAWLCEIENGADVIRLYCGSAVETRDDWFFEGAWAGPFAEGGFLDAHCYGTGARLTAEGITFTPPDHILDRLYHYADGDRLWVSNSLPFLLSQTGQELRMDRSDYPALFSDIRFGLQNARTPLPLQSGRSVEVWSWYHLVVGPDLSIRQIDKDRRSDLPDFDAYHGVLRDTVGAVFENAADPARLLTFAPLTTISSGYDSTMLSVLSAAFGCTEALTFAKSRARMGRPEEDDSGSVAASILGLTVHDMPRLAFVNAPDMPELETMGAGSELCSARGLLENRVLVTGFMGDTMWDREPRAVSSNIFWPIIAGQNLTELRLAQGFVHFCVPFVSCRQQNEIIAISRSAEMAPWRLMNDYDRPICRRICEEAGIPRDAFGQKKRAAGVFYRDEGMQTTMTPQSYADYTQFRSENSATSTAQARRLDRLATLSRFGNSLLSKGVKVFAKATGKDIPPPDFGYDPGLASEGALLFQWSAARLSDSYAAAMATSQTA